MTLYLGAQSPAADAASPYTSLLAPTDTTPTVSPSVRRSARLHFENAVKVASRYMAMQNFAFQHRMRMHTQRQARLSRLAANHRERMWRSLREDGWIFGQDTPVPSPPQPSTPPTEDTEEELEADEGTLPQASYFTLESEVESGFTSDDPDSSPPPGAVEGPAPFPRDSPRATTPELTEEGLPEPPVDAPELHLPSVQWSVHVAQLYLESVCPHTYPARTPWPQRAARPPASVAPLQPGVITCRSGARLGYVDRGWPRQRRYPMVHRSLPPGLAPVAMHPEAREEPKKGEASGSDKRWTTTVGLAADCNSRWRRTMEDAHLSILDFDDVPGQAFFGMFDGHAGKFAAEWCRDHLAPILQEELHKHPQMDVREVLNNTFLHVDRQLEIDSESAGVRSGCTAVTSLLRMEVDDAPEKKERRVLYTANVGDARSVLCRNGRAVRLTYDHKGSDELEAKRITEKGGFLLNNRVNGTCLCSHRRIGRDAFAGRLFYEGVCCRLSVHDKHRTRGG